MVTMRRFRTFVCCIALALFAMTGLAVRAGVIYQARMHYEPRGHLQYVHSETGLQTLKDEFDKVAWHNERHLAQIETALKAS